MSDSLLGKVLKGTAKLAYSYMTETAKSLSRNEHYTEEARSQFGDISDAFSDLRDKLDYTPQSTDDDYFFEDSDYDDEQIESAKDEATTDAAIQQVNNTPVIKPKAVPSIFNQITFAEYQWYIIHRDNSRNTALLLSKDIITVMQFSKGTCVKFDSSLVHYWLMNDFYLKLKSKLKPKDTNRLLSISLLSSKDIEEYIPNGKSRVVSNNDIASEWWLCDGKNEFIKLVKSDGSIGKKKPTEKCGVRPVIMIKLKRKT